MYRSAINSTALYCQLKTVWCVKICWTLLDWWNTKRHCFTFYSLWLSFGVMGPILYHFDTFLKRKLPNDSIVFLATCKISIVTVRNETVRTCIMVGTVSPVEVYLGSHSADHFICHLTLLLFIPSNVMLGLAIQNYKVLAWKMAGLFILYVVGT